MRRGRTFRPTTLAVSRVGRFWLEVWKCWRLTLDWTVQVYVALPALFIFANMYRDAWEHPPGWFDWVSARTVAVLLGLLMLRARLRTFADPGDALILRRSGKWTNRMLAVGLVYTFVARLLLAGVAVLLLIPVLQLRLHWTASDGLAFVALSALLGFVWALARDAVGRRGSGWSGVALSWLVRAALMAAWAAAAPEAIGDAAGRTAVAAVLVLAAVLLVLDRVRARGTFLRELAAENDAYMQSVRLLLRYSAGIRNKPSARKPRMSPSRRKLFRRRDRDRRIAELWIKASLRERENLNVLIVLALAAGFALLLVPIALGIILWPVLGALVLFWLHGQWRQWEEERYVAMLPWSEGSLRKAEELGRFVYFYPLLAWWGVAIGAKAGMVYGAAGWAGLLVLPLAGWPLARFLNGRMTAFLASRERARELRRQAKERADKRGREPAEDDLPAEE